MAALRSAGRSIVDDPRSCVVKYNQDNWLRYHGKSECIDFSDTERLQLKKYYNAMSLNQKSVNLPQIEDFLIAFGLCESRNQVLRVVPKAGLHDFQDFLHLLSSGAGERDREKLLWIFKNMMNGNLGDEMLSFPLRVSSYRRKMLLDALMSQPGSAAQMRGTKILNGFAQQLHSTRDSTSKTKKQKARLLSQA